MTMIIDGSNGVTFPNSTIQASAGSVLQVVNATYSTQVSTTSASYVTSNLTASITPRFSTSKILVLISGSGSAAPNGGARFIVYRNGTTALTSTFQNDIENPSGAYSLAVPVNLSAIDSPAATSSTSYTLYFLSVSGTAYAQINGATSSITLMEIAG
jgi:hypothetical protein